MKEPSGFPGSSAGRTAGPSPFSFPVHVHLHSSLLVVIVVLLFAAAGTSALNACESWDRLADEMRNFENQTGFITCEAKNCSGVDCAGFLQKNFTLGVYVDPCHTPPGVDVHGSVPELKMSTEKPWSKTFYPNDNASTFAIPGAKLVIQSVETDVYLTVKVTRFPNATMDVDLVLKACVVTEEEGDGESNSTAVSSESCPMVQQLLKSGPIKVPPCHLTQPEVEVHSAKPQSQPSSVISSPDTQDYNSGGSRILPTVPGTPPPPPPAVKTTSTPATTAASATTTTVSSFERRWSRPCSLKDLYSRFVCNVTNHEVCRPKGGGDLDQGSDPDGGACVCMVAYERGEDGSCAPSALDANGDPRPPPASPGEGPRAPGAGSPSAAESSKYSGETGDDGHGHSESHAGAVAAGILVPLLLVALAGAGFLLYRRGVCPPKSLQQPLRFSLSRFSSNRSPGMVLIGDGGDEEATA